MPTIGHLFIGIIIPIIFYYISHKKFNFMMGIIFLFGSVLPDTFTILKEISLLNNNVFNASHGIIAWVWWALLFAGIFKLLTIKNKKYKIKFLHIYLILLSAGWLHLGFDMTTQPVRLFWKYNISILSFYTPYEIMGEQDVIIFFYFFFIIIPIILLSIVINKIDV